MDDIRDKVRWILATKIKELELARTEGTLPVTNQLAQAYLEFAFASEGEESVLYAHHAVSLQPDIHAARKVEIKGDRITVPLGEEEQTLLRQYTLDRTPGHVNALESFLDCIKGEAKEKGPDALHFHETVLKMVQRGDIPDKYRYSRDVATLTDDAFAEEKKRVARQETGVGSFLSEMLLSREEDRRDKERWKEGRKLPVPSFERIRQIYSPEFPRHVIINEEALGGITIRPTRQYGAIDDVCEAITFEVAKRLPKQLNAYEFDPEGYAKDEITLPGMGTLKVSIRQSRNIFTEISSIETENFRIWNCRDTGRIYLDNLIDNSFPAKVDIKPLNLAMSFYHDGSGSVREYGDDCHKKPEKGRFSTFAPQAVDWLKQNVLEKILKTREQETQITEPAPPPEYPPHLGKLYTWVTTKIAEKINIIDGDSSKTYPDERRAIIPGWRLVSLDVGGSYPSEANYGMIWCGIGEVQAPAETTMDHTLLDRLDTTDPSLQKEAAQQACDILFPFITGYGTHDSTFDNAFLNCTPDTQRAYLDEAIAKLSQVDGFAKEAERLGRLKEKRRTVSHIIPGHRMDSEFSSDENQLVQVTPKNGKQIYVVDYDAWDTYREEAAQTTDTLSDAQYNEMHRVLARTMVPVTEYQGNYIKPVVVIARPLGFDEVKVIPGIVYNP